MKLIDIKKTNMPALHDMIQRFKAKIEGRPLTDYEKGIEFVLKQDYEKILENLFALEKKYNKLYFSAKKMQDKNFYEGILLALSWCS